jgi:hypothetical protein
MLDMFSGHAMALHRAFCITMTNTRLVLELVLIIILPFSSSHRFSGGVTNSTPPS